MYLEKNRCELTIVNELGKAAVVASLGPGDFFGESCLAGQRFRMGTATAIPPCTVLVVEKDEMFKALTSSMPSLTGSSNTCWHGSQENAGGDDRHNAFPGQFVHEQIQKARIRQVYRRPSDRYFSLACCLARVISCTGNLQLCAYGNLRM
jgi:hypothetical protein